MDSAQAALWLKDPLGILADGAERGLVVQGSPGASLAYLSAGQGGRAIRVEPGIKSGFAPHQHASRGNIVPMQLARRLER